MVFANFSQMIDSGCRQATSGMTNGDNKTGTCIPGLLSFPRRRESGFPIKVGNDRRGKVKIPAPWPE